MNTPLTPRELAAPAAAYSLAVLSHNPNRILHTSGIVGARPDGAVPDDIGEQAAVVWDSIAVLLAEAHMSVTDIVSYHTYVVHGHDLAAVMAARDAFLQGHRPCSTLVPVPALARPDWKVEIAVIAIAE